MIALPLGLIAVLLGMNVGGLPATSKMRSGVPRTKHNGRAVPRGWGSHFRGIRDHHSQARFNGIRASLGS